MKKLILTAITTVSLVVAASAQNVIPTSPPSPNLSYGIRVKNERPITKEALEKAQHLSDLIADYPFNWITDYVSVEIVATDNGKIRKAVGSNNVLSPEQKNILGTVNPAAEIEVNVNYQSENVVTHTGTDYTMHVVFTVVPETEAQFVGGYAQLDKYMKEKGMDKIANMAPKQFKGVAVRFTINEQGKIVDTKVSLPSGSPKIDRLILDSINQMPRWKPAKDAKGIPVKQVFEFKAGMFEQGC